MELFEERDHFIIQSGEHALWCNRFDGTLTAKRGSDICNAWNPICLGKVHGVIGKMKIHPEAEWKLLLIRQRTHVGKLPDGCDVYCINRVTVLPLCLDEPKDLDIELCEKHHFGISKPAQITKVPEASGKGFTKTWNSIKSAAESVKPKKREIKEKEKFERRILEELMKMFNDSDSFYYSPTGDLTNSVQRRHEKKPEEGVTSSVNTDDRFFWNKQMLQDLICSNDPLADPWIIPIIQGYVQIETCQLDFDEESPDSYKDPLHSPIDPTLQYTITLISRRSRYRAGTRYKRRGVDEEGHCANYVETEQIMQFMHHQVSFVQVRGSVPVFWSQTGIKYKPPPRIEKGDKENTEAFVKHMDAQLDQYGKVAVVNLVDQTGKEKVMQDAFLKHVVQYNQKQVTYIAFDFHEYCRGMKFENVSILIDNIKDIIKDVRYCWVDKKGMICDQLGVFRVNCIDCLDRTNVVQSAIARLILETQCRKLGLLPPDEHLPTKCRQSYQQIWANNGDTISRQYAGTAALKGDYTRTGERKFTGLMKDGMNSANRYYLNRFKDLYRQATIDLMLGNPIAEDLMALTMTREGSPGEEEDAALVEKEENMKTLIDECKKMLITEPEDCLGGWGLIDADPVTGDPTQQDMDIILLLSQRAYYIANYDDEKDQVTSYQKIYLEDLDRIEIGPSPSLFKSKHICIRMYYNVHGDVSYFHTLRTTGTRLFNNMVIHIKNDEEARESLKAITESFNAARKLVGMDLEVKDCKLERRRSKPHDGVIDIASEAQRSSLARNPFPLSRESSGINLRDVIPPTARNLRPKINISRIGKTFQGFNIINKVKINRSKGGRMAGFMPAVWYSKEASEAEERGSSEQIDGAAESAKILKGDHIITAQETFKKNQLQKRRSRKLSIDEIEAIFEETDEIKEMIAKDELEIEAEETDLDVLLDSCGILATRPTQVLNTLVQARKTKSLDMVHLLALETQTHGIKGISAKPKSPRMPLRTIKDNLVAASMTRSLDFDDLKPNRRVVSEGFSGKQVKVGLPAFQEVLHQESMESSSMSSDSDAENVSNPCEISGKSSGVHFTIAVSEDTSQLENGLGDAKERPNESETAVESQVDQESSQKIEDNDKEAASETNGVATLTTTDITTEAEERQEEEDEFVVPDGDDQNKQKRSMALYHPSMKMSLSDGSISYHQNVDELTINLSEPTDGGTGPTTSAFSKLKVRMSNLALPTIPSQQAKRQLQEDMAADNRLKSQLQYRHLDTKILLL